MPPESSLDILAVDEPLAESATLLVGAEWRIGSWKSSAMVLVDLTLSPKLRAAADLIPEISMATMARAMLSRLAAGGRVADAVERAGREKQAQLVQEKPELWKSYDADIFDFCWAKLREDERQQWSKSWEERDEWGVSGTLRHVGSAMATPAHLRNAVSDENACAALLNTIACAATAELQSWAREAFGAEAVLAARAASPRENAQGDAQMEHWALAALESAELKRAASGLPAKEEIRAEAEAATAPDEASGQGIGGPREMLAWEFPLANALPSPWSALRVVVGLDASASVAVQDALRAAPHMTAAEVAAGFIRADAVVARLVDRFAQFAQGAGFNAAADGFGDADRALAKRRLQAGWGDPDADLGGASCDALTQGAKISVCRAAREVFPLVCARAEEQIPGLRERVKNMAALMSQELETVAAKIFGAQSVVFVQSAQKVEETFPLLAAYAQKAQLAHAAERGQATIHSKGANLHAADGSDGPAAEEPTARKPRSL